MDLEDNYEPQRPSKKIRLRIVTNRNLQFITAVKYDATVSDLANRALSVYLELSGEGLTSTTKKQLTVSAVKQGVFYMPKSEYVASLLNSDDQVEVVIIKAKPKYPNQLFQNQESFKKSKGVFQQSKPIKAYVAGERKVPLVAVEEVAEIERGDKEEVQEERDKRRIGQSSKRQKKKEKKRQKWEKKKQLEEGEKGRQKGQLIKNEEKQSENKSLEFKQIVPESLPRKKVKLDQEVVQKSPDKPQFIVPSPKITFHQQPKIDSPRIPLLSESHKKKHPDYVSNKLEGPSRKVSEDQPVKSGLDKIISPKQSLRSPNIGQKTPMQLSNPNATNEATKGRQKEELSNFSLSRKGSDDRRGQLRPRKQNQENGSLAQNRAQSKEIIANSISSELAQPNKEERTISARDTEERKNEEKKAEQRKVGVPKGAPTKSLVIVQPPSESDNEENKNMGSFPIQSSRFKQLAQLKNRIKSFMIESEDEP